MFQKSPVVAKEASIFLNANATPDEIAAAGEQVTIVLFGGYPNTHNLDELRYKLFASAAAKINFNLARLLPTRIAA